MAEIRDTFDVAYDRIVDRLESYAAAEKAADAAREFSVIPDNWRRLGNLAVGAHALVYSGPVSIEARSSASAIEYQQKAEYYIDCITRLPANASESSSERTGSRLRYLFTQVMRALHDPNDWYLGFSEAEIQRGGSPRIEPLPPDLMQTERAVLGGRVTIELSMSWTPQSLTETALTDIYVDAQKWDALFTP